MTGSIFENEAAFAPMGEALTWRADKAPHHEAQLFGTVVHGEGASANAGHVRAPFSADPYTVILENLPAAAVDLKVGDTLRREDGTVLTVQQISSDPLFGVTLRTTANERAAR